MFSSKKREAEADTKAGSDSPPASEVFHDKGKITPPTAYGNDNESLISDTTLVAHQEGIKPAFLAKANVLNKAIQDIGMGRYQYELFFSGGFGWFADNIWLQAVAIVMDNIAKDTIAHDSHWDPNTRVRFATLSLFAGLIVGAAFWGITADIIGRRFSWNCTLFIGGVFGVACGAAPTFVAFCCLIACMGFGVGGNLPVDGTMFLEFMPGTHQWLLTLLSLWWAVGQVVASLIAWGFVSKYSCPLEGYPATGCDKSNNSSWRYTYYTLGAMMLFLWAIRYLVLPVYESPKFLASVGKDHEAIEIIHKLAKRNGKTIDLTYEDLQRAALPYLTEEDKLHAEKLDTKFTVWGLIKNSMEEMSGEKMKILFANKRIALSTSLIIICYGCVGLAYPLYNGFLGQYLAHRGAESGATVSDSYRAYTYQAACGVPGSFAAAALVTWSRAGRKFAMAFFTLCAGICLFGLTACRTMVQVNAVTSISAFFQNAYYGVLFGYAPELFPTPVRGTGDALCASFNRICGFMAPIIAIFSSALQNPDGPVFASASIYIFTGILMCFLPVETYGKTAL